MTHIQLIMAYICHFCGFFLSNQSKFECVFYILIKVAIFHNYRDLPWDSFSSQAIRDAKRLALSQTNSY